MAISETKTIFWLPQGEHLMDNSHDWQDVGRALIQGLIETVVFIGIIVLGGMAASLLGIFQ